MAHDISQRAEADGLVRRSFSFDEIEVRADDSNGFTFEGIASVVDHPYPVRDQWGVYTETIKAGAFNTTIKRGDNVLLLPKHRQEQWSFASTRAGTMKLVADPHLRVQANLDPARPDVHILRSVIKRGEATEMSIGFVPVKARDKWNKDMTEVARTQVDLREVSIVEAGANTGGTSASVRAFDDFLESMTETDMTQEQAQRALAFIQARFPHMFGEQQTIVEEPAELFNPFAERDRLEREALERKRRPPYIAA